jgi:hypothetical protein
MPRSLKLPLFLSASCAKHTSLFCHNIFLSLIIPENLAESNKRADALAIKLEQSEKARQKAEADAAPVEDLRKRLHDAETSLS